MSRKNKIYKTLFILLVLIQIYIPASMIMHYELALKNGQQIKFKAAPVDPYDPFRGRYVYINVQDSDIPLNDNDKFREKQTVYVQLEKDEQGFARMTRIFSSRPQEGVYLKTKIRYIRIDMGTNRVAFIDIPFNRYYMEEKSAPAAEKAYFENAQGKDVYVTVRVLSGMAVLEKLYIEGIPVEEYIKDKTGNRIQ